MKLTPNVTNFPRIVRCAQLINKINFVVGSRVNYYFDYNQSLNNCTITGIRLETANVVGGFFPADGTINYTNILLDNFALLSNFFIIPSSLLITLVDVDGKNIIDDMPLISLGLGSRFVAGTSNGYNYIRRFSLKKIDWSKSFVRFANPNIFGANGKFSIILSVYYVNNSTK